MSPSQNNRALTTALTKNAERKAKFQKLGQALTAYQQAWAERRGELINQEYRGKKSADENRAGPRTLQIVELYKRTQGIARPMSVEEQEQMRVEAEERWEFVKHLAKARNPEEYEN